jgi:hypothetical protein
MATLIEPLAGAAKHEQVIHAIATEMDVSVERVRAIYELECSRLDAHARVKTFVPLIATRLVKTALQSKQ